VKDRLSTALRCLECGAILRRLADAREHWCTRPPCNRFEIVMLIAGRVAERAGQPTPAKGAT
jgi:hypothetical protein